MSQHKEGPEEPHEGWQGGEGHPSPRPREQGDSGTWRRQRGGTGLECRGEGQRPESLRCTDAPKPQAEVCRGDLSFRAPPSRVPGYLPHVGPGSGSRGIWEGRGESPLPSGSTCPPQFPPFTWGGGSYLGWAVQTFLLALLHCLALRPLSAQGSPGGGPATLGSLSLPSPPRHSLILASRGLLRSASARNDKWAVSGWTWRQPLPNPAGQPEKVKCRTSSGRQGYMDTPPPTFDLPGEKKRSGSAPTVKCHRRTSQALPSFSADWLCRVSAPAQTLENSPRLRARSFRASAPRG
ncbi:uncharacterized protein LOC127556127 [Antechinus flavipes]|uniref:uncharacterized protein LOC127556127 n=1 Tax=Antechinus flavipes TaxID=38775 RepID=UPI0022368BAB|nr:uncharacterized protein LOC127556127 [Antechinus flavipes]